MSLSCTQELIFQGVSLYESGRLNDAIVAFQQAGSALKTKLVAPPSNPKELLQPEQEQPKLLFKPVVRQEKPEAFTEADSFMAPFAFWVVAPTTQASASAAQDLECSDEQLAACTATLLFNLGLCYQAKGYASCLVSARRMYEKAWACSCRHPPSSPSDSILCLQMAIAMNLASTLFLLGDLEMSHTWITCLQAVLDYYSGEEKEETTATPQEHFVFTEEWLHFFYMACVLRQPCIAAGAA